MRHRRGVTLIELLIVLALIGLLSTLIIAAAPKFGEKHRATRGAAQLQSWLNLAKQRAMRDQRPVGIRLPAQDPGTTLTPQYVRELQYVELPGEGVGGTISVPFAANYPPVAATNPGQYQCIRLTTTVQFFPDNPQEPPVPPGDPHPEALVRAGDTVLFTDRPMGAYPARRIAVGYPIAPDGVRLPSKLNPQPSPPVPNSFVNNGVTYFNYFIVLDQSLLAMPFATQSFQVARKARPIVGEPVLQFPKDIGIDVDREPTPVGVLPKWYRMFPATANSGGPGPFDILFSPGGQVVGYEGNLGSRICLWVRDVSQNTTGPNVGFDVNHTDPTVLPPGENTLIVVQTRTGHVTAHPIDPSGLSYPPSATVPWNPFKFTQDGMSSSQQ